MATQILVNELVVGEIGTDRLTTVGFTTAQALVLREWFEGRADEAAVRNMLLGHDVLSISEDAALTKVHPSRGAPWVEVRWPDGAGYRVYVPVRIVSKGG